MNEIVKPAAQWISQNIGWTAVFILFIFSLFFEFSKIKLSPITAFLKWIGDRLTSGIKQDIENLKLDTEKKIQDLDVKQTAALEEIKTNAIYNCQETQKKLDEIERQQDAMAAARIKAHVLNFSRSLRIGEKHTEEDFQNLIKENEEYQGLVAKHSWTNDVYKADYEYFYNKYQQGDFLQ